MRACAPLCFFLPLRSPSHGQFVPRSMGGARSTPPVVVPNNCITVRTASCLVRVAALPPIAAAEAPPAPRPARAPGPSSDPTWPRPDAQRTAPRQHNRRASTPYFLGTQNTAECTNGNDIESEAQCKEAAAVLGKTYKNSGSWSNWPNACYYSTAFLGTGSLLQHIRLRGQSAICWHPDMRIHPLAYGLADALAYGCAPS